MLICISTLIGCIKELGFSKEEFRTAFKKLAIVYKSKRMYDNAVHKFKSALVKNFGSVVTMIKPKD